MHEVMRLPQDNPNLEEREIRGLNFKILRGIAIACVTIILSICATYYDLKMTIAKSQATIDANEKIADLKFRTLELRIEKLELEMRDYMQTHKSNQP
jgi:CHASE3 domain sensor protein